MDSTEDDITAGSDDTDFQRKLFEVPDNCEFPLEISCHLKEKLHVGLTKIFYLYKNFMTWV